MAPYRSALLVAILGVGLAGCTYTSPVVAPPMDIDPPAAARLASPVWQPTTQLELAAAFREALVAYERAVRQLEHSAGASEPTRVRVATQRLGVAIATVPHDRSDLVVAWSARALMGDELWIDAATPAGWEAAAERAIAVASLALARIVERSYAGAPDAAARAAALRARAEALRAGRDQGGLLGAFRDAQRTLDAIAAHLAREEAA